MASQEGNSTSPEHAAKEKEEEVLDDDERELDCIGYQVSNLATFFYYVLVLLSAGGLWLVCRWKPVLRVYITCGPCSISEADTVVFKDNHGSWAAEDVFEESLVANGQYRLTSHEMKSNVTSEENLSLLANREDTLPPPHSQSDHGEQVVQRPSERFFIHHKLRFIFDPEQGRFVLLRALDSGVPCVSIRRRVTGLTMQEHHTQKLMFGTNSMDVEVKPYWKLIIDEALDPFYIFQVFSLILWVLEVYYIYAGCILFISCISILTDVVEVRRQMQTLHDMIAKPTTVMVMRSGKPTTEVSSRDIVPGDIVVISSRGLEMPCDAALLSGTCVVNESMLTGESVPVTKTPLPDMPSPHDPPEHPTNLYSPVLHKRHTLFCGTRVIQTRTFDRDYALAIVVRTGFATAKGSLVRSILFPKPVGFQFFRDALRFVGFLAILAIAGVIYSLVIFHDQNVPVGQSVLRALDVVTIAVPPALPAAMTIGVVYALRRLKKKQIFCISPPRINICGKLKLFCFDKTGTLTNDGMDLMSIVPVHRGSHCQFAGAVGSCSDLPTGDMLFCMASCHSLNVIDDQLVGDPLDLKMFEATSWVYEERSSETRWDPSVMSIVLPPDVDPLNLSLDHQGMPGLQLGITHQYTFSSELQRMSVVVQRLGAAREANVYCKGAPETIVSLCDPLSVPDDFADVLVSLTQQGYRVLACAARKLTIPWHMYKNLARVDAEKDLQFLGLLVLCNTLKPETTPIIKQLLEADIRTVMVTGDNIQTAVSVARECGMIQTNQKVVMVTAVLPESSGTESEEASHSEDSRISPQPLINYTTVGEPSDTLSVSLSMSARFSSSYQNGSSINTGLGLYGVRLAISGKSFAVVRQHCPVLLSRLMLRGTVFARMAPQQKTQLVQELQSLGYSVGMCGDGANDCGALKAAHAGISLSEAEASIASPFTSKVPNIECVPTLIREGRTALVTSFSVFKFMALYSIIQFVSVLMLYTFESNLGDTQYLYIDLVIILTFAFVMGRTEAYPELVRRRPPGSLAGVQTLSSLIAQMALQAAFQAGAYQYLVSEDWFKKFHATYTPNPNRDNIVRPENYVIFVISSFQYIWVAVAFSGGKPYRRPMYTNYLFSLAVLVLSLVTAWLLFFLPPPLANFLQLDMRAFAFPLFRVGLLEITLLNFAVSVIVENFILPSWPVLTVLRKLRRKKGPKNRYKVIDREICEDPDWPPIGTIVQGHVQGIGNGNGMHATNRHRSADHEVMKNSQS